ncbi:integrator complex subunit 14 [Drosophila madeirensis]|uniref:Integrator complex subunit 14 n=1 Tax=Drosophila madeirensis TaxID=30013 RepID=A0AAU9FI35_DROMD
MPTIIAVDASISMLRQVPGRNEHTYLSLAIKGIQHLLDNFTAAGKLEHLALMSYTMTADLRVDFTRDYDQIRQAVKKIETVDKSCLLTLLKTSVSIMSTWGAQNVLQLVVFTDCGLGFCSTSISGFLETYAGKEADPEYAWLRTVANYNLNFICLGLHSDLFFTRALVVYQQLLDAAALKGQLFMTPVKNQETNEGGSAASAPSHKSELGRTAVFELIERLCETSYKSTEVTLRCGSYFRMEAPVLLWPPTTPYEQPAVLGGVEAQLRHIDQRIEVCGFLALSDIGSPATLSRHWVLPKVEREKTSRRSAGMAAGMAKPAKLTLDTSNPNYVLESLEQDIREFYAKDPKDTEESGDDADVTIVLKHSTGPQTEQQRESLCVLLHGALKMENMAALVRVGEKWYGFIYAFTDAKKKSNLMLNILPPGSNVIPWLGDLELLGFAEDLAPGETASFPVRADRRSYSQSSVVWIRQASLQSDVQKVLRHAKKMPDKTQHFYKELNRIRRAALALGFVELLEALAMLLEKECAHLTLNGASNECTVQLQHAATELRKTSNRDIKSTIVPHQKGGVPDVSSSAATASTAGYMY